MGKYGDVFHYDADYKKRAAFKIPGIFEGSNDQGAFGLALDPAFLENRFVYVAFVTTSGTQSVVQRFSWRGDGPAAIASLVDILRISKDNTNKYHGIGAIHFNPQGILLVPVGDPTEHAQKNWHFEGKLLGLIPGRGPKGGYSAPDLGWWHLLRGTIVHGSAIVMASGLRSPWTATPWGDWLIIGDVGGNGAFSTEEINAVHRPGLNFGWGACEDPHLHGPYTPPSIFFRRNDPVPEQDYGDPPQTSARSVLVGAVYDNPTQDRYGGKLNGRLLYGDFYLGFIRGALLNEEGAVTDDVFLAKLPFASNLRIGPDGYIYAVTAFGEQGLLRLVPR